MINWQLKLRLFALLITPLFSSFQAWAKPPCEPTLQESQRVLPDADSQDFIISLNVSLILALQPSTFPEAKIQELTDACTIGKFMSSEREYKVFGSNAGSPPRWALSESRDRIAYVATAPPTKLAFEWYSETGGKGPMRFENPPIYILAVVNNEFRDVFAFLETLPSDDQLMRLFQAALDGDSKRLVRFNTKTNKMDLTAKASDW